MILLFVNHYRDKDNWRNSELEKCLRFNINNNHIDKIFLIAEETVAQMPDKCETIVFKGRPTYEDMFAMINERAGDEDVSIIINSDIYTDHTISLANKMGQEDCYALSRWDIQENGSAIHFDRRDSQDTWIFKGKIKWPVDAKFTGGIRGTDNALAYRLQKEGYKVTNPSYDIKTYHLHLSGVRYYDMSVVVPSPYLLIQPHHLSDVYPQYMVV